MSGCPTCDGAGKVKCDGCDGSGVERTTFYEDGESHDGDAVCHYCDGDGEEDCPDC